MTPRMVMHPFKPELDGQDVGGIKDPAGTPLFQRFVQTVREHKAGYVSYQWPKPGQASRWRSCRTWPAFEPWAG